MSVIQFTSDFFNFASEALAVKRVDAKHPDQSRPQYEPVGSGFQGIVKLEARESSLQSEKGLDTQDFIYSIVAENTDISDVQNKDIVSTADDTEIHIIHINKIQGSIYSEMIGNNVADPNIQKRR